MPIVLDYAPDGAIMGGYFYAFVPEGAVVAGAWQVVIPGAIYARQVHVFDPAAQVHGFFGAMGNGQVGVMAAAPAAAERMLQEGGDRIEETPNTNMNFPPPGHLEPQVPQNPKMNLLPCNDLELHPRSPLPMTAPSPKRRRLATPTRSLIVKLPIAVKVDENTGVTSIANSVRRKRRKERDAASVERQEMAKRKVVRAGDVMETDVSVAREKGS